LVTDKLQALYESETNFATSTFCEARFTWKLGDDMNGFVAEGEAKTMHQAVAELVAAALCKFPDSVFAHKNLAT
jgi:hypothetical protein